MRPEVGDRDAAEAAGGMLLALLRVDDPTPEQSAAAMLVAHALQDIMEIRCALKG